MNKRMTLTFTEAHRHFIIKYQKKHGVEKPQHVVFTALEHLEEEEAVADWNVLGERQQRALDQQNAQVTDGKEGVDEDETERSEEPNSTFPGNSYGGAK